MFQKFKEIKDLLDSLDKLRSLYYFGTLFWWKAKTISENDSVFQEEVSTSKSKKEQLQELKEMLDDGLITQEDFEQKKKQILGLWNEKH